SNAIEPTTVTDMRRARVAGAGGRWVRVVAGLAREAAAGLGGSPAPGPTYPRATRARRYFRAMERDAAWKAVFKPVRLQTTFEETVERLGTAIRLGILPPGSRLPAERALADQLGISRSTLRQALTTL